MAIPVPALVDTLEFLSDEIKEGIGVDVEFPVDKQGAEYIFFPAVSDYIMEADTLMGNAAVFRRPATPGPLAPATLTASIMASFTATRYWNTW